MRSRGQSTYRSCEQLNEVFGVGDWSPAAAKATRAIPAAAECTRLQESTYSRHSCGTVSVRVARPAVAIARVRRSRNMWDDTADMPFEQRFIAHRTVPVGPAALELEQTPPTLGGADPLGTACTVWRGGERLVELLQSRRELVAGKRIVELGSGTGIAGLACAALGASAVVLTDLPENLPLLRRNVTRNGWVQSLCGCEVSVEKLDWNTDALPACDLVLGADVCYHQDSVKALCALVNAAIAAGSTALLACERHEPIAYAAYSNALRRHAVDVLLRDDGGARRFEVLLVTAHPLAAAPPRINQVFFIRNISPPSTTRARSLGYCGPLVNQHHRQEFLHLPEGFLRFGVLLRRVGQALHHLLEHGPRQRRELLLAVYAGLVLGRVHQAEEMAAGAPVEAVQP